MITREDFLTLDFVKKEDFTGSHKGMRFMLHMETVEEERKLQVYLWSEPFCFTATSDDQKISAFFAFSEEGLAQAIDWMNENYEAVRNKKDV